MVEDPPRVLCVRSVVVVSVVVNVVVVPEVCIVHVHRVLENVVVDGGTVSALTAHRIAAVLADEVETVVEPGCTLLDLRVAPYGDIVSLVVVVVARENTVGVNVTV